VISSEQLVISSEQLVISSEQLVISSEQLVISSEQLDMRLANVGEPAERLQHYSCVWIGSVIIISHQSSSHPCSSSQVKPALRQYVLQPEEAQGDVEHFQDLPDDDTSAASPNDTSDVMPAVKPQVSDHPIREMLTDTCQNRNAAQKVQHLKLTIASSCLYTCLHILRVL
jgi:hypothetical protein